MDRMAKKSDEGPKNVPTERGRDAGPSQPNYDLS